MPTKILIVYLQPIAYTLQMDPLTSSMPSTQFMQHLHREHQHPFYFRYHVHCLLFLCLMSELHSCIDMLKESSSQYPIIGTDCLQFVAAIFNWNSALVQFFYWLKIKIHLVYIMTKFTQHLVQTHGHVPTKMQQTRDANKFTLGETKL